MLLNLCTAPSAAGPVLLRELPPAQGPSRASLALLYILCHYRWAGAHLFQVGLPSPHSFAESFRENLTLLFQDLYSAAFPPLQVEARGGKVLTRAGITRMCSQRVAAAEEDSAVL